MRISKHRMRRIAPAALFLCVAAALYAVTVWAAPPEPAGRPKATEKSADSAARTKQRDENFQEMEKRAVGTKIRPAGQEKKRDAELIARPLFHYTDEPRRIVDATLWGWLAEGRLLAVCKIEKYDHPQPERIWLYCLGSLATGLIEAEWPDGRRWSAKKPGIEMKPIAAAPAPAAGKPARLRQMKEISNRFQATITDTANGSSQEMRLLPRPIFRYEKPSGDLLDGAVFGLTTNGTNPDALLIVELLKPDGAAEQWQFAVAGMTAGALSVKFDDKEVWTKPYVGNTGSYETWTWFFGKNE